MSEISVFVQKKDSNKFLDSLFNEFDSEIISLVGENQLVLNAHEEGMEKIYDVIAKSVFEKSKNEKQKTKNIYYVVITAKNIVKSA